MSDMDELFASVSFDVEPKDWRKTPESDLVEKGDTVLLSVLTKSAKKPKVERDPKFQAMIESRGKRLSGRIVKWMNADAKRISALLVSALFPVNKADMAKALTQAQIDAIVDSIDLNGMKLLAGMITEDTVDVFKDAYASGAAIGGMAVDMNLVTEETMLYAQTRAAELVGMVIVDGKAVPNPNPAWSISETTRNLIRSDVHKAITEGASAKELADAIESNYAFSDTRSINIARTELSNAFNTGSMEGWKASGVTVYKRSLLSDSHDIADICDKAAARGAIPLDEEFADGYMAPAYHVNCLISGTVVLASDIEAHYTRRFKGKVVTIVTTSGKQLTATPNHPVLTDRGWIAVGALKLGDCVFESVNPERLIVSENPNDYNVPTAIEQIPDALVMHGGVTARQVPTSAIDFHGDGVMNGDVDIVFTAGFLESGAPSDYIRNQSLKMTSTASGNLIPDSSLNEVSLGSLGASDGIVSGGGATQPLFGSSSAGGDCTSLTATSNPDAALNESTLNPASSDAVFLGQRKNGLAAKVECRKLGNVDFYDSSPTFKNSGDLERPDNNLFVESNGVADFFRRHSAQVVCANIVDIRNDDFSGHVYNLQTVKGWYVANGIVTHNCLCSLAPVVQKTKAKKTDLSALFKGDKVGHAFRGNQWTGGKATKILLSFENAVKNEKREYAQVVLPDGTTLLGPAKHPQIGKMGNENSVSFTQAEFESFKDKDAILTHNHPLGYSFSDADLNLAESANLLEIRATTPHGTYTLRRGENGWPKNMGEKQSHTIDRLKKEHPSWDSWVDAKSPSDASRIISERAIIDFVADYPNGATYAYTKHK